MITGAQLIVFGVMLIVLVMQVLMLRVIGDTAKGVAADLKKMRELINRR